MSKRSAAITALSPAQLLVSTLLRRVRVMTQAQARDLTDQPDIERHVQQLIRDGIICELMMSVHPLLELRAPLACWQPGLSPPDFKEVATLARARWTMPECIVPVLTASELAGQAYGGKGGRPPRTSEATHDLHLTSVYLRMLDELPTRAESWMSEAMITERGMGGGPQGKLPDALVRDGSMWTAIELVGMYSSEKLLGFHCHCDRNGWGYELW